MNTCYFFFPDRGLIKRVWRICVYEFWSGPLNVIKPLHRARMCLLVIGNLCNWALAFWGVYRHQKDFALFLLAVFMGNTMLYFCFYIIMKVNSVWNISKICIFFFSILIRKELMDWLGFSYVCRCCALLQLCIFFFIKVFRGL